MKLPPHLQIEQLRMTLGAILDAVDYTAGNCRTNDMVSAALDRVLIINARKALADTKPDTSNIQPPAEG